MKLTSLRFIMPIEFNNSSQGQIINSDNNLKITTDIFDALKTHLQEGKLLYYGKKTCIIVGNKSTLNLKFMDETSSIEKMKKIYLEGRVINVQKALEINSIIKDKSIISKELKDDSDNQLDNQNEVKTIHDHHSNIEESVQELNSASPNVVIKVDDKWKNTLAQHKFTQIQVKHTNGQTQVFTANITIQAFSNEESVELQQKINRLIEMAQIYQKQNQEKQQEKHKTDETKITFSARELPRVNNVAIQETPDSDNKSINELLKKNANIVNSLIIKTMEQAEENQRKLEADAQKKKDLQDQVVKEDIENSEIKSDSVKSDIIANLISNCNIQKWLTIAAA